MRVEDPDRSEQAQLLVWALAAGTLGGCAALALRSAADWLVALAWPGTDLVHAVAAAPLAQRLAVPVGGALVAAIVLRLGERLSGPSRGWDILEAVLLRDGVLHLRPALAKACSSLLTVASAGAVGREGPLVLVAAAVASQLGQWRGVPTRHLRLLTGCGVAAGLAAAYNTPLGAALFTMEVIFGSFAFEVFGPLVFASGVATLLTRAVFGHAPIFGTPRLALGSPGELAAHVVLGAVGGLLAAALLHSLRGFARLFRRSRLPLSVTLPLSGLALGVATLGYPEVVGNGREAIVDMFARAWPVSYMVALLALRLVITPMTVGAGAVGGVFTPTLLMGALLGGVYGRLVTFLQPAIDPRPFALVGMGCVLAGTTHAPLTSVVMLFEMTLDYDLVLPLLLASAVSTLVARRLAGESVYTEALRRQGESAATGQAAGILTVRDVMREEQLTVAPQLPLPQVLDALVAARRNHAYVVDSQGSFLGAVNLHDVHRALREAGPRDTVHARDVAVARFEAALPDERLDQVLERFWRLEAERLPVVADAQSRLVLGTVSKRDILGVSSLGLLTRQPGPSAGRRRKAEVDVPGDVIGLTLEEARFGERHDVSLLMIRRAGAGFVLPDAGTRFEPLDRLIVLGPPEAVAALLEPGPRPAWLVVGLSLSAAPLAAQQANYVELRGSSTRYRFVDYNRTLASRLVLDALYIGVPGQDELYLGVGRSLEIAPGVSFAPYVYAVAGLQRGERGLVAGAYLTVERGPVRAVAFLGRFVRLSGDVASYDFADSIDLGWRSGRWEVGGSTTTYRTGEGWSAVGGPLARRHDARGAWSVSLRAGYETELRLVRTLTF